MERHRQIYCALSADGFDVNIRVDQNLDNRRFRGVEGFRLITRFSRMSPWIWDKEAVLREEWRAIGIKNIWCVHI
jgi:hypothetical protein